ncbi:hypothetical protein N7490_009796 [Penicillium lividum]|nr:hypothetical protein N7490_009796 [Penicillium lividum]
MLEKENGDFATDQSPFDTIPVYGAACQKNAIYDVRAAVSLRNLVANPHQIRNISDLIEITKSKSEEENEKIWIELV